MKLDPDMHIGMHLVSFGKSGVTGGPTVRARGGWSSWRWRRYGDLEAQVSHGIEREG
jgi:hypothetical protein